MTAFVAKKDFEDSASGFYNEQRVSTVPTFCASLLASKIRIPCESATITTCSSALKRTCVGVEGKSILKASFKTAVALGLASSNSTRSDSVLSNKSPVVNSVQN